MNECEHDWARGAWSGPRCRKCHIRLEDHERIEALEAAIKTAHGQILFETPMIAANTLEAAIHPDLGKTDE